MTMRTIKMMKCGTGALILCIGSALHAANTYSYDPDDAKSYIVTVPSGEINSLDSAAIGILTGGGVTNFVKRGEGTLSVSEDLSGFVGNVHIEEGVYLSQPQVKANTTLGSLSGHVFVADGATLRLSTSVQDTYLTGKTIHFAGDGYDGQGALVNAEENAQQMGSPFGASLRLTGDAKVATYASQWFLMIPAYKLLEFDGHTLTTYGANYPVRFECPARMSTTSGTIVATGVGIQYWGDDGYSYFNPSIRITDGSHIGFASLGGYWQGKLTLETGAAIRLYDGNNTFQGSVVLDDPVRNRVELRGCNVSFPRVVSGGGLFVVGNDTVAAGNLTLSNTDNSFSNGVTVTAGATLTLSGYSALPNKGPLVLTNASVIATGSHAMGATWTLPQLFVHGTGLVANATGTWKSSVTKTGDGELVYNSWINSNVLNLNGGRFTFPAGEYPGTATPGINDRIPQFKTINAAPGTMLDLNGHSYTNNNLNGLPTILNCPEFAVKTSLSFSASDAVAGAGTVTDGAFRFMGGAMVSVTDVPAKVSSQGVMATVLSAADGIVGFPGCAIGDKWRLSLSADGKSLVLSYPPKGMVISFK